MKPGTYDLGSNWFAEYQAAPVELLTIYWRNPYRTHVTIGHVTLARDSIATLRAIFKEEADNGK